MEGKGTLKAASKDLASGKLQVVFELESDLSGQLEGIQGKPLRISAKRWREKRSLDANAYYWVLIGKLARVLQLSNPELHNLMLCRYGQPEVFEGKPVYMTIPDTEAAEKKVANATDYHLQPTSQVREGNDGIMYRTYKLLRGSHTFNTEEMARLIDGLIEGCKDAGIPDAEIATPDEKRLLKERYGVEL